MRRPLLWGGGSLSVADFLISKGVGPNRITENGYGETEPIYTIDSEEIRAKNRRVELGIYANGDLKKDASEGKLQ